MDHWLSDQDLGLLCSSLRISPGTDDFDTEIYLLVDMCISDLESSGAYLNIDEDIAISTSDPYLFSLIRLYVLANFGIENPDAAWYTEQFLKKKAEILNKSKYAVSDDV